MFVNQRLSGWRVPQNVPRVGAVIAHLYGRDEHRWFGAGERYFAMVGESWFASRRATTEELDEFVKLVEVPRAWLTNDSLPVDSLRRRR